MDWTTETGIPCFRPHTRRDPEGNVLYEVTAADLPEIARNSSTLTVELHGNKPPITEGHRNFKPDAKECDQPLVLGYLENFRMGTLPDGVPCIVCDRKYMSRHAQVYQRHPFPSVDYIPSRRAIVGLAKLTRPPALNMGSVYYPGTTDPVYVYAVGDEPTTTNPSPDTPPNPNPPPNANNTTPLLTPEELAGCKKIEAYLMQTHPWMKAAADKYAAEFANPSATNTGVPKEEKGKEQPDTEGREIPEKKNDKVETMSAELVQKYQAEQDAMKARLAKAEADLKTERDKRQAAEVDALLDTLEKVESYQFDREAERAELLGMDDAARQARATRIRKYHPQVGGTADQIEVYRGNVGDKGPATTQKQAAQANDYAAKHDVPYADALAAVKAGKA